MPQKEKGAFYVPTEKLVSIVEGVKQGNPNARTEMYQTFKGYLGRYIYTKVPGKYIEELIADTFYDAYKNIDKLEAPAALTRWLRSIAHSKIYHFYKKREREQKKAEKDQRRAIKEKMREVRQSSGIDLSDPEIRDVVNTLPETQKEAAFLRAKGLKVREIAKIQNVSDSTVKSRLNYARKKINAYAEAKKTENIDP